MDMQIRDKFITLWQKYFNDAELPITFYYTDKEEHTMVAKPSSPHRCLIAELTRVRQGENLCFNVDAVGCAGGKRYLGFTKEIMPDFEYFLSCGIPGKLEGERYKKSPEMVKELVKNTAYFTAPAPFIVFKRWDKLEGADNPEVVIFYARPDVLSGLFTLANYDEPEPDGVITPMGSGCSSIVQAPYMERDSSHPRGVIGMFDISARPYVPEDMLTFSAPLKKFLRMIENMEESFLITGSWQKIQKRI
jgi:uncharacterized protein (DUF169 family)